MDDILLQGMTSREDPVNLNVKAAPRHILLVKLHQIKAVVCIVLLYMHWHHNSLLSSSLEFILLESAVSLRQEINLA